MSKSIAVFGGNGFLGRKICEIGVSKGYKVTSFSRIGKPPASVKAQPWVSQVSWNKVDIFHQLDSIQSQLAEFDTVVHSIGILFEDQSYKQTMNSKLPGGMSSVFNDLKKLSNNLMGSNPMQRDKQWMTYEAIQRDSAVGLADAYVKARQARQARQSGVDGSSIVGNYVYISADQNPPMVPKRYITTKREAEAAISRNPYLRSILMRPSVMYDNSQDLETTKRDVLIKGLKLGVDLKRKIVGDAILGDFVRPVVSTTQVSEAIYNKLEDPQFHGIVPVELIEKEPNW
ncbi:hypothetical protein KGF56_002062 [Candida oxycetoniae]|uniref:NAD-dependent epimerase/dehydratase domain-containing protein n=1 Tax=Candida oxycetoniae TaxID=497107 RepID=A0AAI9WYR0_9ASCO|nr:uncharacterized protein KGF56_002062 [Candida oxycetoniae]KAI3405106.2 hypothetical protein KGF56_002062 [Candida oxycetoniae]